MIVLGDMPLITVRTINKLWKGFLQHDGNKIIYADCTNQNVSGSVYDKVPHKVWPGTWGTRIALVGWANGPKLR